MKIISFLDLDDTLFQTLPKCPPGEPQFAAARGRDGAPLSFMTEKQKNFLDWLLNTTTVIPVTARNRNAFERVDLPFHGDAILDFGGVILTAERTVEAHWHARMKPLADAAADQLHAIQDSIATYNTQKELRARARLISDADLPLYVVVKHPDRDLQALERIRDEHLTTLDLSDFCIHQNDNNLSVVPRFLGKDKAVRFLLKKYYSDQSILTLGIGDSLTDVPFMQGCDFAVFPQRSQALRSLTFSSI